MTALNDKPGPHARLNRLHHAAWVTQDMAATRQFYEDVVGLPLTACWKEKTAAGVEYCHVFFEIGDGGALAFFEWTDEDQNPRGRESPGHLALECDAETQAALKDRLEAAGYQTRLTDHGYCVSLYVNDPNNLRLEFTVDAPDAPAIYARHTPKAHEYLRQWLAGDRTPNNDIRSENSPGN
jgi:catechol 2,3-dioxygenase-like lactoylglutathione lyase family enzyme